MTPDEAAWVRANAWTEKMRRWPFLTESLAECDCMVGICSHCRDGQHQFCHRRRIKPRPEWWITNRPTNYIPPTAVWHADRACRSLCPCCPAGPPRPVPRFELAPLFDLATP
ncbi:DUF6248 family natural product biosynthesis protein [Nonomuraea bangladeshensis]|uniref:DUF6248 family natural product biosynthesis protein n=1 Tax=Nonomuraea bangladeshensis TaxID=404385 RepID=A0ABV3H4D9_9ACTN